MSYLMEIAFDNNRRLKRKSYLFEYKNMRFRLIQDYPRRWADHLLTVLPNGADNERAAAFAVAAEILSALGWQLDSRICGMGKWRKRLAQWIVIIKSKTGDFYLSQDSVRWQYNWRFTDRNPPYKNRQFPITQ